MLSRSANLGLLCVVSAGCVGLPTPPGSQDSTGDDSSSTGLPSAVSGSSTSSGGNVADETTSSGTTTDADTEGSSSGDVADDGTSSSEGTTGGSPVEVPFTVLDPTAVPLPIRVNPGWYLFENESDWDAHTGAPVPPEVDFDTQWLLYGSRGPDDFPGQTIEVTSLTFASDDLRLEGSDTTYDSDCERYRFVWPVDTLLAFDALETDVRATITDLLTGDTANCAMGVSEGMDCNVDMPCAPGLLCAGLIRSVALGNGRNDGICLPESNAGVFYGEAEPIPSDGDLLQAPLSVSGLATVDMDVAIWVEVDHPAPQELIIQLRNPDGNQVPVTNLDFAPFHPGGVGIVPTGFSGDESVNGTWTLVVQDTASNANNGTIMSWELEIMSRLD
ncbi:MAG: proprotein convertase P-domain-containing protein [Myxococcota bacterium]